MRRTTAYTTRLAQASVSMTPSPRPRARSSPSRFLLVRGLALFLVGTQLLGLAHLILQRHGVCWEHGVATELQGTDLASPATDASSHQPGFGAGESSARLEDRRDHDHCSIQTTRRDWAPCTAPALALAVWPGTGDSAFAEAPPHADQALLLRAPKQSPPSRA